MIKNTLTDLPVAAPESDDALALQDGASPPPAGRASHAPLTRLWAAIAIVPLLVLAITLFAAVLRFYRLDARGLWFDELVSAYPVRLNNVGDVLAFVDDWQENMPLAYLITWLLRGLGGSEIAIRLPFTLAGVLNIPAIYLLGRALAGRRVGLMAALLMAVAPFALYYSQEARPYTFLMLFTTLQLLFAYRAAIYSHLWDWLGLALFTLLNLYNDYLAFAPSIVVALFLVLDFVFSTSGWLRSGRDHRRVPSSKFQVPGSVAAAALRTWNVELGTRLGMGLGTLALVFLLYLPWLSRAAKFATDPALGFNRLPQGYQASWADLQVALAGLGLSGTSFLSFPTLWLVFLAGGVISSALWVVLRTSRPTFEAGLLLLLWLMVPLVGVWLRSGEAMLSLHQYRYFAYLVPLVVLLAALAADGAGRLVASFGRRLVSQPASGYSMFATLGPAAVLGLLVLANTPAMAQAYSKPKSTPLDDYRSVAERIMANSPPSSLVLTLGSGSVRPVNTYGGPVIDGVDYYLWAHHTGISVVDGSHLSVPMAQLLDQTKGRAWGVVYSYHAMTPQDKQRAADAGLALIPFSATTLVEPQSPGASPRQQIDTLLAWSTPLQPGLLATRALVDADFQSRDLGDNLLPPPSASTVPTHALDLTGGGEVPEKWALRAGTSLAPDGQRFVLEPGSGMAPGQAREPEVNVTLTSFRIKPGPVHVISFRCYDQSLVGTERVYVREYNAAGKWLDTYPYGDGYVCAPNSDGEREAFAFDMLPNTTRVVVSLSASGSGRAEFDDVQVQPVK